MVWYYGCVTEIYVFGWFLTALLIFVSFKKNGLYFVLPILALGTGFRQSSGVLLSPFAVYLFYLNYKKQKLNFKYFLYSIISAVIIFVVWFLPMVSRDGGILGYIALYSKNNPVELISLLQNWFRMSSLMLFFIAPLFISIIAFLMKLKRIKFNEQSLSELKLLFSILIIPMLFFVFGHYSKGYILLIAFPIFAIIGILIKEKVINNLIVFTTISAEILLFVVTPYHQGDVASIVKSQVRQKSVPSVWYDRTFSNYSLTRGRIKFESEKVEKLKLLINKSTSMKFFIDPTLSFYTRVLQYYFPKRKFITLNLRNESEFFMFHKLAVNALPKEKIIMKNIMFISRNDFINSYVGFENINIINKDNSYSLFQIDKQYESKLFRIYKKLFLRL